MQSEKPESTDYWAMEDIFTRHPEVLDDYRVLGVYGVKKTLHGKYKQYYLELMTLIGSGQPIPNVLAKRYFTLFRELEWIYFERLRKTKRANWRKYLNETIDYFAKFPEYHFTGSNSELSLPFDFVTGNLKQQEIQVSYSFNEMVESCLHSYVHMNATASLDNFTKVQTIRFFHDRIGEYCLKHLSEQQLKEFSNYKRFVTSAYLTLSVGFRLFDKDKTITIENSDGTKKHKKLSTDFRNEDLYKVARSAIRPQKNKA